MTAIVTFLKKWWPTIVPIAVAVWGVVGTQLQMAIAQYPKVSTVLAVIAVILTHLLPSPVASSTRSGTIVAKVYAPEPPK